MGAAGWVVARVAALAWGWWRWLGWRLSQVIAATGFDAAPHGWLAAPRIKPGLVALVEQAEHAAAAVAVFGDACLCVVLEFVAQLGLGLNGAVHKQHHVGVLLDGPAVAQVAE